MKQISRVFKHELLLYFRDKKLVFKTLILPIFMYPLIFVILAVAISFGIKNDSKGIKVYLEGNNPVIQEALKNDKLFKVLDDRKYTKEDILDRKIDAIVILPKDEFSETQVLYDATKKSMMIGNIHTIMQNIKYNYLSGVLSNKGLNLDSIKPIRISEFDINSINSNDNKHEDKQISPITSVIGILLPMFFLIFPLMSTSILSVDLGAGEKEKMTLEPLMCTKMPRYKLVIGKLTFISLISVIIAILSILLLGGSGYLILKGFGQATILGSNLPSVKSFAICIIILVLTVIFLSALQLTLSFFAKNYKDGQVLQSPLMIVMMAPIFMSMFLNGEVFYHIPIFNVVLMLKELLVGTVNMTHIITVCGWLLVYIVLSVFINVKAINSEKFVFRV